jgi:5-deoxy-glucuronate isomerase
MSKLGLENPAQVFRKTNAHEGFKQFFSSETGAMRYLSYGRIEFTAGKPSHTVEPGKEEHALFCIKPSVHVKVDGEEFTLGEFDMLYVPRNARAEITGDPGADLVLAGSISDKDSKAALVKFNDIKDDPEYFFAVGSKELGTERRIFNMLGHNVDASRLLAGFTIGQPSAWTSWPPHEHADSKEEFYLFFNMPKPAFSVQFVYSSVDDMEFAEVVQDGDCVTIPGGYHPTAAAPGYSSMFLWVMAGYDPEKDRDFKHGINIQPDYQAVKFL